MNYLCIPQIIQENNCQNCVKKTNIDKNQKKCKICNSTCYLINQKVYCYYCLEFI